MTDKQRPSWQQERLVYNLENLLPILFQAREISREQAKIVQESAKNEGISIKAPEGLDFLLSLGLKRQRLQEKKGTSRLTEKVVLQAVGNQYGLQYKLVDYLDLDLEVSTRTISESFARNNLLVPLRVLEGKLELLVFNPFRPELWEDMGRVTSLPYIVYLGSRAEIKRLIDDFFQFRLAIRAAESEFGASSELGNLEGQVEVSSQHDRRSHKHVIKAVDYLLRSALRERASDIHMEPKRHDAHVRFRIDGVLHTLYRLPQSVHGAMLSRLKSLSRLDIAEKRRPQDGRFQIMLEGKPSDVRVSTIPIAFGEKLVLRILSSGTTLKKKEDLGMSKAQVELYQQFLQKTHGLLLVTGPTGSGKSTTLYSTLKQLAKPSVNVVTVEDPIEMVVDDFNQIGVQTKVGVTFASTLRHILRQDPDIIMVGEMRDLETGEQAIQAALTGHLVFSTLHTNDTSSTLTRLIDLGIKSYLVNASLIGIVAQRLVRSICPHCKSTVIYDQKQLQNWGIQEVLADQGALELSKGKGCEYCRYTGYLERTGIFEILPFDSDLKEALRRGDELADVRSLVRKKKIPSLFQDGVEKAKQGITTLEEVIRVTGGSS